MPNNDLLDNIYDNNLPSRDGSPALDDADLDDVSAFWNSSDDMHTESYAAVGSDDWRGGAYDPEPYDSGNVEYDHMPIKRRWRNALLIGVPVLCLVLMALLFANSARLVMGQVDTLKASVSGILDGMKTGDEDKVMQNAEILAEASSVMKRETDSPVWYLACGFPIVGKDLQNVQAISEVVDDFSINAVKPMAKDLAHVSAGGLLKDGAVDVEGMKNVVVLLGRMEPVLYRAEEAFSMMEHGSMADLNNVIDTACTYLNPISDVAEQADALADRVPHLLGADGTERTYLILAQTNSELRSVGGFPGSWGILSFKDGVMNLGGFNSPQNIRQNIEINEDEKFVYGSDSVDMVTSVGINPNFPRVAQTIAQIYGSEQEYQDKGYTNVDGVIAVDPIFLQRLMELTHGKVRINRRIRVTSKNTAQFLLSDIYWKVRVSRQDRAFAKVANKAFDLVVKKLGDVDLADLLQALGGSAQRRDLAVWFADDKVQGIISTLSLSGAIHTDPSYPYMGVFLNDYTWSKMDWYLYRDTVYGEPQHNDDGTYTYHVTTHIKNNITPEVAQDAPKYVVGGMEVGNQLVKERGEILTYVIFYGPAGGKISNLQMDDEKHFGDDAGFKTKSTENFDMATVLTRLSPTDSLTISYDVTTIDQLYQPLAVDTTPTAQDIAGWTMDGSA